MAGEYGRVGARRVVAGVDEHGRSAVVEDAETPAKVVTEAFAISQVWQVDSLPAPVLSKDSSVGEVSIAPPTNGFVYLKTTFPPDSEWDVRAGYADALAASGDGGAFVEDDGIPGLHETDTVDIVTVLAGELYAVLETGEVRLTAGDSFVQRGTKHSWSNRSDQPATIIAVMMGATRS